MMNQWEKLALGTWILVGATWGLAVGIYFEAEPKKLFFLAVLGMGVIGIAWLNVPRQKISAEKETLRLTARTDWQDTATQEIDVMESIAKSPDIKMQSEEAREWLDAFLVKQQEK